MTDLFPMTSSQIARMIPHRGDMQLFDLALSGDETRLVARAAQPASSGNPLLVDGVLPAAACIEYAAQAMALHAATLRGGAPRRGFLVVASAVQWSAATMPDGEHLVCEVTRLAESGDGAQYAFIVFCGRFSADGTLTLALEPLAPAGPEA